MSNFLERGPRKPIGKNIQASVWDMYSDKVRYVGAGGNTNVGSPNKHSVSSSYQIVVIPVGGSVTTHWYSDEIYAGAQDVRFAIGEAATAAAAVPVITIEGMIGEDPNNLPSGESWANTNYCSITGGATSIAAAAVKVSTGVLLYKEYGYTRYRFRISSASNNGTVTYALSLSVFFIG